MKEYSFKNIKFNLYNTKNKDNPPIIFSHGYRAEPKYYDNLLKLLQQNGYQSFCVNRFDLENKPITIGEHLDLTADFIHYLDVDNFYNIGHSLGGYIAMSLSEYNPRSEKIIAINPAVQVDYGISSFIGRSFKIGYNECMQYLFNNKENYNTINDIKDIGFGFMNKLISTPIDSIIIMQQLTQSSNFEYNYNLNKDLVIIQSKQDEFFNITPEHIQLISEKYQSLELDIIPKSYHNLPINNPLRCTNHILKYLEE